jgi:U3 small nucleolar RNA-associated protein 21
MTDETYKSPRQISDELVTLSLLPNSRWQHLLQLDVIKQRNKPKEPLRVPRRAPFFLPTIPNLEGTVKFRRESHDQADHVKEITLLINSNENIYKTRP